MSGVEAIVGVVSAGAGLVSLSIQLFESAQKLKGFYDAVRGAQGTLDDLVLDLETIGLTLRNLERHRQEDGHNEELLDRAIAQCRRCTCRVRKTVDIMETYMDKYKRKGRFYVAWKERDMATQMSELERAKSSLQLAIMSYHQQQQTRRNSENAMILHEHGAKLERIHALQQSASTRITTDLALLLATTSDPPAHDLEPRVIAANGSDDDDQQYGPAEVPYTEAAVFSRRRPQRRRLRSRITLAFPHWLTNRIWTWSAWSAEGGWDCNLRTYRHVPYGSAIFRACRLGNLEKVQEILASGEASVFDIWSTSYANVTLLQTSLSHGNFSLFWWLVGQTRGLYPDENVVDYLCTALQEYPTWSDSLDVLPFYRLAESATALLKTEQPLCARMSNDFLIRACPSLDCANILLRNEFAPTSSRPLSERFQCAANYVLSNYSPRVDIFLRFSHSDPRNPQLAAIESCKGCSMLHLVAHAMCYCLQTGRKSADAWAEIGCGVISNGADPCAPECKTRSTPLLAAIEKFHSMCTAKDRPGWIADFVQKWARMIADAGLDVFEYGTRESAAWQHLYSRRISPPSVYWELQYRPNPEDWTVFAILVPLEISFYKLDRTPGAFFISPYLPDVISWYPKDDLEQAEGHWTRTHGRWKRREHPSELLLISPWDYKPACINTAPSPGLGPTQDDNRDIVARLPRHGDRPRTSCHVKRRRSLPPPRYLQAQEFPYRRWYEVEGGIFHGMDYYVYESADSTHYFDPTTIIERSWEGEKQLELFRSLQDTPGWEQDSFLREIVDCQLGSASKIWGEYGEWTFPLLTRHTGTSDCPQGCRNVQVDRLCVPPECRKRHPSVENSDV